MKSDGGGVLRQIDNEKIANALIKNLYPIFINNVPIQIFQGKMETFLTCRKVAEYLREKFFDKDAANFFEAAALKAIYKSFFTNLTLADIKLLLSELPNILPLNYPEVENIRDALLKILPQVRKSVQTAINEPKKMHGWKNFTEYDYFIRMLQTFDNYQHKI